MKKVVFCFLLMVVIGSVHAQSHEAQQLLLNWEKLSQFKKILQNMYDGYKILHKGYTTIKDISEGNFSLHKTFLDRLLEVSPIVKKYKRVSDIIRYQIMIVNEYKKAFKQFKDEGSFSPDEIEYMGKVYANLLQKSSESLDELLMVITAGELRMSDDERLGAIDRIYSSIEEQAAFLKEFNSDTGLLALQRRAERAETDLSKRLYSLPK
ncbi:MAG: TerB family tellurite resistance protein [Chitinophagaceae bacterium]|nr:MAG: TerB family tellurite resistance protein [Chitinophagaceae bacterium]